MRRRGEEMRREKGEGVWYRGRGKEVCKEFRRKNNLPTSAVREAIPPKMKGFSVLILV